MKRDAQIKSFLEAAGWADAARSPLSSDASFRRYERLSRGNTSAILMDAPPPGEDLRAYIGIAQLLSQFGYSTPEILAKDESGGLAVIEDFGDDTYTRVLTSEGADEDALYTLALDILIDIHRQPPSGQPIPEYDNTRFLAEVALFVDWYLPAIRGTDLPVAARAEFLALWQPLLSIARKVPNGVVLRDFHVDNLMVLKNREGLRACGLLDFQDAVFGPVTYDIVSLLEDARRDVSPELSKQLIRRYLDAFATLDHDIFSASYAVMGAQRAMKIIGIFTRLDRRDRKPHYLAHLPRVWHWLHSDLAHPALASIAAWLDRELPMDERLTPHPLTAKVS
jgi:N-acetylmuramate 1-kinase